MKVYSRTLTAVAELLIADLFWGFGFVATIWALQGMGPYTLSTLRFSISFALTALIALAWPQMRRHWTLENLKLSVVPGILLGLMLILQTLGLQYTTATRSGFITGLYVIFVPILERLWFQKPWNRWHPLFVALAMVGTALIVNLQDGKWNLGDVLTVLCSLCGAVQICWLGQISSRVESPVVFNSMQCLWAAALSVGLAVFFDPPMVLTTELKPWIGFWSITLGATWLAFALQVRAQKAMSPALASLLFLLESPLALLFGYALLQEKVSVSQLIGAMLILLASGLAIAAESRKGQTH